MTWELVCYVTGGLLLGGALFSYVHERAERPRGGPGLTGRADLSAELLVKVYQAAKEPPPKREEP